MGNKPIMSFREANIQVSIFLNESKEGKKFYLIQKKKSFMKGNKWIDSKKVNYYTSEFVSSHLADSQMLEWLNKNPLSEADKLTKTKKPKEKEKKKPIIKKKFEITRS